MFAYSIFITYCKDATIDSYIIFTIVLVIQMLKMGNTLKDTVTGLRVYLFTCFLIYPFYRWGKDA